MKIMIMDPPWYSFMEGSVQQPSAPLGACYVAASLEKAGYDVSVVNIDLLAIKTATQYSFFSEMGVFQEYLRNASDLRHPIWNEVERVIREFRPDVLGMTVRTTSFASALSVASLAKNIDPGIKIILGGAHPTLMPEQTAKYPQVDVVVRGEGEITIVELLRAWESGSSIEGIEGISYWDCKAEKFHHAPPRPSIGDLNSIPFPAKHLIYRRETMMNGDDYNSLLNSRGCPYECIFCSSPSVWSKKCRWRSAENMAREIVETYERFDTHFFSFVDDTFTLNNEVALSLCDAIIASGMPKVPGFRWVCNTRPDRLNRPLVERMKLAGCSAIAIGIESGNDEVLKRMKKAYTKSQIREAARIIKETGLVFAGQFMIGLPFETEEQMRDTLHFAEELEPVSVVLSVAAPLPGTELYAMAQQMGYAPETMDVASITTKNDGILFNKRYDSVEVKRIVSDITTAFDALQQKTLSAKDENRLQYERLYKKPVYGIRKP